MQRKQLTTNSFINPHWFNSVKYKEFKSVVNNDYSVTIENVKLFFCEKENAFPVDSNVICFMNNYFECVLESEYNEYLKEKENKRIEQEMAKKEKSLKIKNDAIEFNEKIKQKLNNINWTVGHKDNLSGLSFNSIGNGYKKNTVEHIYLLQDLNIGKLKRNKYDFLCTAKSGSNGKNWSDSVESIYIDYDGNEYSPKITCKTCLKIVNNLKKWFDYEAKNMFYSTF